MIRPLFSSLLRSSINSLTGGAKALVSIFITVNGNDITIFGIPLTGSLIQTASASDPTLILGSNGTDPTKSVAGAAGRAVVSSPVPGDARKAALLASSSSIAYAAFEPLLNVANLDSGFSTTITGGSATNVAVDGRSGVVQIATSAGATSNRRAGLNTNGSSFCTQAGRLVFYAPCALTNALLNDSTVTGRVSIGFLDLFSAAVPTDGMFFRFTGAGNWEAVTRMSSIETAVDTGVAGVLDVWNDFWVDCNSAGTEVKFYINSTLVATIVDTIPTVADRTGAAVHVIRLNPVATDLRILCDFVYIRLENPTQNPYGIS